MSKITKKFISLTVALTILFISSFALSPAADSRRYSALIDAMQIQTIISTTTYSSTNSTGATASSQPNLSQKSKMDAKCDKKKAGATSTASTKRKEISWLDWLTGTHRAPSLHFLDLLELIGL